MPIVSAWADQMGPVGGPAQTEEKSNEITAIPALLKALAISGRLVRIDAMGCHKAIAADMVSKPGGYTPALKETHPEVYEEARERFESIEEPGGSFPRYTEVTKDHGRIEKREAWRCTDLSWFAGLAVWAGLMAMGCVRLTRTVKGVATRELRYYLTMLTDGGTLPGRFAAIGG